jgi:hypothetical protein
MPDSALLDTSFFIRFLNENDKLFYNADSFYQYFLSKEINLVISTISVAEFCVGGSVDQLPLKNLQILPFNLNHAQKTGEFARTLYTARRSGIVDFKERILIQNDAKLFAQADTELNIKYFVTSDSESLKAFEIINQQCNPKFSIVNINQNPSETFGILDLK